MIEALGRSLDDPIRYDRNSGVVFIMWDRMFGTFQAGQRRPTYAVLRDIRGARRRHHRLGYAFGQPGRQPTSVDWSEHQTPASSRAGLASPTP